jgi:transposase
VELAEEQWEVVRGLIPEPARRTDGRGRPWREARAVLEEVLWVLRSGARWKDLPQLFPPYQTCHRRFQHWMRAGVSRRVLEATAQDLHERGGIKLEECFIDSTFAPAKKGTRRSAKPSGAREASSCQWRTVKVFRRCHCLFYFCGWQVCYAVA